MHVAKPGKVRTNPAETGRDHNKSSIINPGRGRSGLSFRAHYKCRRHKSPVIVLRDLIILQAHVEANKSYT